ncbi:glycosyltransferase [Aestuariivirga sp.]|uniref:glycosyltransferase n=1 Tax=Aestuariivirga sp. TaxID=2650926 RepID=UPI0039E685A4
MSNIRGQMSEIAVIIVNYGTATLAIGAVESVLARQHGGRSVEIHLVDNNSPGNDRAVLADAAKGWGSRVTFYPETENHGFGRGNNVVLKRLAERAVPPRYIFFLNPDARLETDCIGELARFLEAHPQAAIAGCGVDDPARARAAYSAFRFPGVISAFFGSARLGPVSRVFSRWMIALPPDMAEGEVDWVSGSGFMARFDAICSVGFFDPGYFLYFEETDMMFALKKLGLQVWFCPSSRIAHIEGAATGIHNRDMAARRTPPYWFQSWKRFHSKNYGAFHARVCALAQLSGSAIDRCITVLTGRTQEMTAHFVGDFFRQVAVPLFTPGGARPQ